MVALRERYALTSDQLAEFIVKAQLEGGQALKVLTPRIRVLLVEDNPADVELTRRALVRQRRFEIVGIVKDGVEALAFLKQEPPFEEVERPDLVLLDLDLPRRNGFEVLRELKEIPELQATPVVVLSGTTRRDAPSLAFQTHAVSFIRKPNNLSDYRRVANQLEVYWSQVTALP
ncbi:MAG: response regulator [Nannocystaceae bacterium]|nr:response regulator [bacterium]